MTTINTIWNLLQLYYSFAGGIIITQDFWSYDNIAYEYIIARNNGLYRGDFNVGIELVGFSGEIGMYNVFMPYKRNTVTGYGNMPLRDQYYFNIGYKYQFKNKTSIEIKYSSFCTHPLANPIYDWNSIRAVNAKNREINIKLTGYFKHK